LTTFLVVALKTTAKTT